MDLSKIRDLYEGSLKQFGVESRAVGWNTKESQYLRFEKLLQVVGGGDLALMT